MVATKLTNKTALRANGTAIGSAEFKFVGKEEVIASDEEVSVTQGEVEAWGENGGSVDETRATAVDDEVTLVSTGNECAGIDDISLPLPAASATNEVIIQKTQETINQIQKLTIYRTRLTIASVQCSTSV